MGCSSCAGRKNVKTTNSVKETRASVKYNLPATNQISGEIVPKSASTEKVKLRYYGGGMTRKTSSGCSSCRGGKSSYSITTSETIMFVSEDAPNGIFSEKFAVGHNYYVTRNQADYLLKLTYRDVAGNSQPKFKEITE